MQVALLEIQNFRGIKTGKIQFRDHTVLIGPNNSSKTTVIEALALVLGRDRLVRNLTEHDFFASNPQPADRIRITATIIGFEPEDFTAHTDWFRDGRAVPYWFDPDNGAVLPEKTHDHQRLACQIVFEAFFNRESLEVETARFFNDGDDIDVFVEDSHVSVPGKLICDIGFFLVPASRSWDRMLSFNSELFRRVIRSAGGLPAETILDERERLRRPEHRLEEDARLRPVVVEVNKEISQLFGKPTPLRLRLTPTDSSGVLEAVVPHFQTGERIPVPARHEGSGLISLQSLFLLLHFGQKRIEDGESFIMALEEPELHLPPAIQRRMLSRLQALSTQTIVTTHSPLVAGHCDAVSLVVVRNTDGVFDAKPLLAQPLAEDTSNAIRKLFQINRVETATAVMSEFVLVPEGRLDFDWLALLLRIADLDKDSDRPCLFGVRVGVVPTSDAKVKETCTTLAKAHPNVVALVDGDGEGLRYADSLDEEGSGATRVLRWPDGWTIEDVVGWVIEADEARVIGRLDQDLSAAPGSRATLITRLKSADRANHGLKGDIVAYEIIANALLESTACRNRTRTLLQAMTDACAGAETPHFASQAPAQGRLPRAVFSP